MLSKEWTKWYLTDNGWVKGERRFDSGTSGSKPIVPYYKVVTYKEEMSSPFDGIREIFEEKTINEDVSIKLEALFGKAPRAL